MVDRRQKQILPKKVNAFWVQVVNVKWVILRNIEKEKDKRFGYRGLNHPRLFGACRTIRTAPGSSIEDFCVEGLRFYIRFERSLIA